MIRCRFAERRQCADRTFEVAHVYRTGTPIHLSLRRAVDRRDCHSRLSEIERDLGIGEFQKPLWDAFVGDVRVGLRERLFAADIQVAPCRLDYSPSLQSKLQGRFVRLAVERKALAELMEIVDVLYRSFTPMQQARGDRLPSALWRTWRRELGEAVISRLCCNYCDLANHPSIPAGTSRQWMVLHYPTRHHRIPGMAPVASRWPAR